MTRDEAVRYFKRHIDLYCVDGICREAEEMAIEALNHHETVTEFADRCRECGAKYGKLLKQQPCEDAISRQAVEKIINDHRDSISVGGYWGILERMKKLPAVNPLKKVKLGTLMCGDEFVSRGETYKVDSVFNGIVVCENVKTGRYMYMDMESEVNTEGGGENEND